MLAITVDAYSQETSQAVKGPGSRRREHTRQSKAAYPLSTAL